MRVESSHESLRSVLESSHESQGSRVESSHTKLLSHARVRHYIQYSLESLPITAIIIIIIIIVWFGDTSCHRVALYKM